MFLDDSDEDIDRDGNPYLRLHRVLRRAVELFDPKTLLDPLEEELHLPTAFVKRAYGGGGKDEVVGDEHQRLAGLGVLEANTPQMFGAISAAVVAVQRYGLVAEDAGRAIRRRRLGAIHDVDSSGFRHEHVEGMDIVQFAVRDVKETRNIAPQIQQRVHLHRRLGGAKVRPRKDR